MFPRKHHEYWRTANNKLVPIKDPRKVRDQRERQFDKLLRQAERYFSCFMIPRYRWRDTYLTSELEKVAYGTPPKGWALGFVSQHGWLGRQDYFEVHINPYLMVTPDMLRQTLGMPELKHLPPTELRLEWVTYNNLSIKIQVYGTYKVRMILPYTLRKFYDDSEDTQLPPDQDLIWENDMYQIEEYDPEKWSSTTAWQTAENRSVVRTMFISLGEMLENYWRYQLDLYRKRLIKRDAEWPMRQQLRLMREDQQRRTEQFIADKKAETEWLKKVGWHRATLPRQRPLVPREDELFRHCVLTDQGGHSLDPLDHYGQEFTWTADDMRAP